jgi:hypothetical protein
VNPTSTHRRVTATAYGGPRQRVRDAIERSLPELAIGGDPAIHQQIVDAGLSARVIEYGRQVDDLLDRLADHVLDEVQPLLVQLGHIRGQAAAAEAERMARAPRINGLRKGAIA